jgi:hypothetical protein
MMIHASGVKHLPSLLLEWGQGSLGERKGKGDKRKESGQETLKPHVRLCGSSTGETMDKLEEFYYFITPIYHISKPEFLEAIKELSDEHLQKSKEFMNAENPMTVMSTNFSLEPKAAEFAQYVSQTAWNVLTAQGYDMEKFVTYFTEMWTQEHNFHSSMDTHVHGHGAQISAFYFWKCRTMPVSWSFTIHAPAK